MKSRSIPAISSLVISAFALSGAWAQNAASPAASAATQTPAAAAMAGTPSSAEAPDMMIKRLSTEVLDLIKADKGIQNGDTSKVVALVDSKIMPNVNFLRMTSSAVGRTWRSATPEQQKKLQDEFKTLLVRTYSGALAEVRDQTVVMKPLRAAATDSEVTVRSEVKGRGDPIPLGYRMEKAGSSWKIYDLNVADIWLVDTYRSQFAQEINANGIDGLIAKLAERNKPSKK